MRAAAPIRRCSRVRAGSNLLGRRVEGEQFSVHRAAWPASPPTICPWSRATPAPPTAASGAVRDPATRSRPRNRGQRAHACPARSTAARSKVRAPCRCPVDRRELFLAVAAPVVRGHEDHPRRTDRRHVLGVVAGARADPAMPRAAARAAPLDRDRRVAVERRVRDAPVGLELVSARPRARRPRARWASGAPGPCRAVASFGSRISIESVARRIA